MYTCNGCHQAFEYEGELEEHQDWCDEYDPEDDY